MEDSNNYGRSLVGADCRRAFGSWRERYHILAFVFGLTLPVDLLGSTTNVAFDLFLFLTR
jgi:hypothetical protein